MNCVGIDVSKGKSTVAVMRPLGEVVISPFEVLHTTNELKALAERIKGLSGETRVVMEHTGNYHLTIASSLHNAGIYVSAVNAMLVHNYDNNSLRRAKTDKRDAIKLANYGLAHWSTLPRYSPEENTRLLLKSCNRQHEQYAKMQTMLKNNLMALLEQTFPNVNRLFTSRRKADGKEKWVDFVAAFWHCECVSDFAETEFSICYHQWCRDNGYNFSQAKARQIYAAACECPHTMPKSDTVKLLVVQAVAQLKTVAEALSLLEQEMQSLAATLPEYSVVMQMFGVGQVLGHNDEAQSTDRRTPRMSTPYDDIIELPHPVSEKHPRMSMINRAAQFAPFQALTGYGDAIRETTRLTDQKIELTEIPIEAILKIEDELSG